MSNDYRVQLNEFVEQKLMALLTNEAEDRADMPRKLKEIYHNGMPLELKPRKHADGGREPSDNYKTNLIKEIVDKAVRAAIGNGNDIVNLNSKQSSKEEIVKEWVEEFEFNNLLTEMFMEGCFSGHNFMEMEINYEGKPYFVKRDPSDCIPLFTSTDVNSLYGLVYFYTVGEQWYARLIEQGFIVDEKDAVVDVSWFKYDFMIPDTASKDNMESWVLIRTQQWMFDFCPFYSIKNLPSLNSFYGTPDVVGEHYDQSRLYNRILSNNVRLHRSYSNPVRFAWGIPKLRTIKNALVNPGSIFSGQAKAVQDAPASKVLPGDFVHFNTPDGKIGHDSAQGDLAGGITMAAQVKEDLMQQTSTRNLTQDRLSTLGPQSGFAIKLILSDEQAKAFYKHNCYSPKIKRMLSDAMLVMGHTIKPSDFILNWPSSIPTNAYEEAQIAEIKSRLGISGQTLFESLGLDYAEEVARLKQQDKTLIQTDAEKKDTKNEQKSE